MPAIQLDAVANYIREVAADKIEPRFKKLGDAEIQTKSGPNDLVTIADIEAEEDLTKILQDVLPGSHVVGEEAVSREEIDMSLLSSKEGYVWVIDPVDGTNNFANGRPIFGTIVSLNKKGETLCSWIYDIPKNRMAIAEQGAGVEINNISRQYPTNDNALKDLRGFVSRKFLPKKMQEELKPVLDQYFGNTETYLCCAHEYLDILDGEAYFSLYSRIRPWDHLAGAMMLNEAGGVIRKWDGSHYKPGDERGGLINTPHQELWDEIFELLIKQYL
ncbi:MAG: inositol monophosphatase family protein [Pseudomonadota bacterium]